jgi:hypothetical protein
MEKWLSCVCAKCELCISMVHVLLQAFSLALTHAELNFIYSLLLLAWGFGRYLFVLSAINAQLTDDIVIYTV